MEPPSLKLRIEKGPRHGQTLDCNPGSNIRIGRFVRGNTFVIKNASISSNHLLIEFCNSSWVLQDLDSSNGTFLNDTQLKPFIPTPLHDADIVKIGDTTSILVNVVPAVAPDSVSDSDVGDNDRQPSLLRRNPRRRAKDAKEKVSAPAVNPRTGDKALNEEKLEAGIGNLGLESEIGDVGAEKKAGGKRRGRPPRKGRVLKDVHEEVEEKAPQRRTSARRMRGAKTQQQLVEDVQEDERVSEVRMVEQVEKKAAPATRRMRGAKNQQQLVEDAQEEEGRYEVQKGEVGVSGDDVEGKEVPPRMSTRSQRNKQQTVRDVLENSSLNQDAGQETGNVRRRKNAKDNPSEDVKINNEKNNDEVMAEKSNMEQEARKESESSSGPKESGSRAEEVLAPDLEKMTLGEWLDYLEMALPRQIRSETERVIEGMKRRAQEVSEHVKMKKNEKGKQPMT